MKKTLFHIAILSAALMAPASTAQEGIPLRGPDYFRDASDLARTLGSAHAIRVRCNGRSDQYWRGYMSGLLDMEAPNRGNLRSGLVAGFNDAYTQVSAEHLTCDSRAIAAEAEFAADGQSLANRLAMHYFPTEAARDAGRIE